MKLITISGLDGSGKSTQIKLLQDYLTSQRKKVFYFHAIQFGIASKILNLFKKEKTNDLLLSQDFVGKNNNDESVVTANKFQIWLRKIFLSIDSWRFKRLIAKLEKESYDYLISDRYFYDSVVNMEYLSSTEAKLRGTPKLRFGFIKKSDLAIYLQTSPEIIMQRERKPDQGLGYLQKKKEIYDKYADIWNLKIINGNRSKEEIFEEIKKVVVADAN